MFNGLFPRVPSPGLELLSVLSKSPSHQANSPVTTDVTMKPWKPPRADHDHSSFIHARFLKNSYKLGHVLDESTCVPHVQVPEPIPTVHTQTLHVMPTLAPETASNVYSMSGTMPYMECLGYDVPSCSQTPGPTAHHCRFCGHSKRCTKASEAGSAPRRTCGSA